MVQWLTRWPQSTQLLYIRPWMGECLVTFWM